MAQYLDLDGVRLLWSKVKAATNAGAVELSIDESAGYFDGFTMQTIHHDGQGEDGHVEYKLSLKDVQKASELQTLLQSYVQASTFNALNGKVTTLIGSDAEKSVRTIANEELASQLIPASAQEALDTLQEIAAWIQNHPSEASAFNVAIQNLQAVTALPGAGEDPNEGTIAYYAKQLVDAESQRAQGVEAALNAAIYDDTTQGADSDGILKRLSTVEAALGTPEGGDISSQVKAIQDAIEDLDYTVAAPSSSITGTTNVLTGFEIENGKLKEGTGNISFAAIESHSAITQAELQTVLDS